MSVFSQSFLVDARSVDRFGRAKPSTLLYWLQEAAGNHFARLEDPAAPLSQTQLFWAVSRHHLQIHSLPRLGQTVTVQTWPMPTTRVAYPRAFCFYDADGAVLARAISLWVLMDKNSRALVLPDKSGVSVPGQLLGGELTLPRLPVAKAFSGHAERAVTYSLLDRNGHMNNTYYMDWVSDLLDSSHHRDRPLRQLTVCYQNEALEGQQVALDWCLNENILQVDAHRTGTNDPGEQHRIFTAQVVF